MMMVIPLKIESAVKPLTRQHNRCDWALDGSQSKFSLSPSAVSKPSCSFLGKPKKQQQTEKIQGEKEEGRGWEGGKREQGTEAAGWLEVLLTFAAIVPQISWQTLMALSPCRSLLTFTISCAITAFSVWAKGITITVCRNKTHTYTQWRDGVCGLQPLRSAHE